VRTAVHCKTRQNDTVVHLPCTAEGERRHKVWSRSEQPLDDDETQMHQPG
jgi:hypothetical protein